MTPSLARCLVVNPYGIGDVLCSRPLLRAVRQAVPEATIGYLCNRRTEALAAMLPEVNQVFVFEKDEYRRLWRTSKRRWAGALWRLARDLRAGRWETALDLSLNWQFGAALAAAGIPRRCGFDFRGRGRFLTHRLPLDGFHERSVIEYDLQLLALLNLPRPSPRTEELMVPELAQRQAQAWLAGRGVSLERPLIGIAPGGGASWGPNAVYKQWPAPHFGDLINALMGAAPGQVLLLGDAEDAGACQAVARATRHPTISVGPAPSLPVLAGALRRCRMVVGNDSGIMHLAVAVNTPTVTIFGPASPVVYGPHPLSSRHRVAVKRLACRPCYQRFRLPPCPWGIRCLTALEPTDVAEISRPLLAA